MGRVENWERILASAIEASRLIEFEWGKNDCLLWSMRVVEEITGKDYVSKYRGKYHNEKTANELLEKLGKPLDKMVDTKFERIKPIEAMRGDLVFYKGAVGICDGLYSFFMKQPGDLVPIKTTMCRYAWRVK